MVSSPRAQHSVLMVGLFIPLAIAVLANIPSSTDCGAPERFSSKPYQIAASRIEIQPWWGPHHVYGTFIVPEQYKRDRLFIAKLMIQSYQVEFVNTTPEGEEVESEKVKPGYYIKKLYLPTRTALWFLLTGRFGDLKMTCHWWLVIENRIR